MVAIFFQLVDATTGEPYKQCSVDKVRVAADADVADLRKEVKKENPNTLSSVDASQLTVYKDRACLDKKESLEEDFAVVGLGGSKKDSLLVVVPDYRLAQYEGVYLCINHS